MKQIIIQPGDSLWSLAAKHLGDPFRWKEIWRVNHDAITKAQLRYPEARRNMRGPDWIFDGDTLIIPN